MTDHYAEATRLISATDTKDWNHPSPYADRRIAAAQVHAILALAEQQRIANLIELEIRYHQNLLNVPLFLKESPDIAQALRIETQ